MLIIEYVDPISQAVAAANHELSDRQVLFMNTLIKIFQERRCFFSSKILGICFVDTCFSQVDTEAGEEDEAAR